MTQKENLKQLPEPVAAKYSLKPGFAVGTYYFRMEKVQLDQITLEKADEITAKGFDVLFLKKPPAIKEDKK